MSPRWMIQVTHFRPNEFPQSHCENYVVQAPTAADAVTIANLRYSLPWKGQDGTATANDSARITDMWPEK